MPRRDRASSLRALKRARRGHFSVASHAHSLEADLVGRASNAAPSAVARVAIDVRARGAAQHERPTTLARAALAGEVRTARAPAGPAVGRAACDVDAGVAARQKRRRARARDTATARARNTGGTNHVTPTTVQRVRVEARAGSVRAERERRITAAATHASDAGVARRARAPARAAICRIQGEVAATVRTRHGRRAARSNARRASATLGDAAHVSAVSAVRRIRREVDADAAAERLGRPAVDAAAPTATRLTRVAATIARAAVRRIAADQDAHAVARHARRRAHEGAHAAIAGRALRARAPACATVARVIEQRPAPVGARAETLGARRSRVHCHAAVHAGVRARVAIARVSTGAGRACVEREAGARAARRGEERCGEHGGGPRAPTPRSAAGACAPGPVSDVCLLHAHGHECPADRDPEPLRPRTRPQPPASDPCSPRAGSHTAQAHPRHTHARAGTRVEARAAVVWIRGQIDACAAAEHAPRQAPARVRRRRCVRRRAARIRRSRVGRPHARIGGSRVWRTGVGLARCVRQRPCVDRCVHLEHHRIGHRSRVARAAVGHSQPAALQRAACERQSSPEDGESQQAGHGVRDKVRCQR